MFTKISKLITRDIEVTQEFIDFRDGEIAKGSYNKKNNYILDVFSHFFNK